MLHGRHPVLFAAPLGIGALACIALAHGGCGTTSTDAEKPADSGGPETTTTPAADANAADAPASLDCNGDRADDGMWVHLRCTGLYVDFAQKRVASGVQPYRPALELWSDGAEKQRWLFLPAGAKVDTSNFDEWSFPNGTKAWKEFRLDGKRVETRLYEKGSDGTWRHAAFRWNDDESDAARKDGETIPRGGPDTPPYQIPTPNECNDCHAGRADKLLGVEAVSLGLSTAEGVTLGSLASSGALSDPPPFAVPLAFPEDASGKAAAALGWMHVNCGPCHNRRKGAAAGQSNVFTLARASELGGLDGGPSVVGLDAYATTANRASTYAIPDGGGATFFMLKPGDPSQSLVSYLSGRRVAAGAIPNEKEQMPPIASRVVDAKGHALLDEWIGAMSP